MFYATSCVVHYVYTREYKETTCFCGFVLVAMFFIAEDSKDVRSGCKDKSWGVKLEEEIFGKR